MHAIGTALILLLTCSAVVAAVNVNELWDYGKPELSEQRFRAALVGANEDDTLILQTQIARTYGFRSDFAKARSILLALEPGVNRASAEARVRYALELGRTYGSTMHTNAERTPENLGTARRLFLQSYVLASKSRLDALAIDALHMVAIVEPAPDAQVQWNLKAIAAMEQSDQPDARRWEGTLRNNLGYAYELTGDNEEALAQYRLSRAAYERSGRVRGVRSADAAIASRLRLLKQYPQAIAIQLELERAWDADGQPNADVFQELELLYQAVGDEARAKHYGERLKALQKS